MKDFTGKKFIYNDYTLPCSEFMPEWFQTGASVYEVIRIIDGLPLFYQEHFERFVESAKIKGNELWLTSEDIKNRICKLIKINDVKIGNIKLVFTLSTGYATQKEKYFLAYFIKHRYPTPVEYKSGVDTASLIAERPVPNAKIAFKELREKTNDMMEKLGVYEIILANKKGYITEGSRSNIFFVKDDVVHTPPSEAVLPGITRSKVLEICSDLGIKVIEKPIKLKYISYFDSAFLTGTSPMILPIRRTDSHEFDSVNGIISSIFNTFKLIVDAYITKNKNIFHASNRKN